jgi:hypothetical protein
MLLPFQACISVRLKAKSGLTAVLLHPVDRAVTKLCS